MYPKLIHVANTHASDKVSMNIKATFESSKYDNASFHIQSKRYTKFETNKQESILKDLQNGIDTKVSEGSWWKVLAIDKVFRNISKFPSLKGSSYSELPEFIKRKKAIINVYNEDDRCFLYSILAFSYPTEARKSKYQSYESFVSRFYTSMLNFPWKIDSTITKFEKASNLIVNIFSEEGDTIVPIRISPNIDDVYTPLLNDTKDVAITKDNIKEYNKQLLDLNTNTP